MGRAIPLKSRSRNRWLRGRVQLQRRIESWQHANARFMAISRGSDTKAQCAPDAMQICDELVRELVISLEINIFIIPVKSVFPDTAETNVCS